MKGFTVPTAKALMRHDWPGNVRELENVVSRGVLRAAFGRNPHETVTLDADALDVGPVQVKVTGSGTAARPSDEGGSLNQRVERFERRTQNTPRPRCL